MTNLEKYYDKLTNRHGVNKNTKQVTPCKNLECFECIFGTLTGECGNYFFPKSPLVWLNEEYKEPYEITSEELAFCNMVHTGILWRDDCDKLLYSRPNLDRTLYLSLLEIFPSFAFVHNDTPIAIEDILNNYILKESE